MFHAKIVVITSFHAKERRKGKKKTVKSKKIQFGKP